MSDRCFWDAERGMVTIRKHPDARFEYALSPDEVRKWMATGTRPEAEEPARCPTCGRAFDCCCGKNDPPKRSREEILAEMIREG